MADLIPVEAALAAVEATEAAVEATVLAAFEAELSSAQDSPKDSSFLRRDPAETRQFLLKSRINKKSAQ